MVYSGDTDFQGQHVERPCVTIGQSASTISLSVSNANPSADDAVTLTATVTAASPGVGSPTGTVEFLNNGNSIGTGTLSGGVATLTTMPADRRQLCHRFVLGRHQLQQQHFNTPWR